MNNILKYMKINLTDKNKDDILNIRTIKDIEYFMKMIPQMIKTGKRKRIIVILDQTNLTLKNNLKLIELGQIIVAINIKDIKKKYSFIYDLACKYLDNIFKTKNICEFKNKICIKERKHTKTLRPNGCCCGKLTESCQYLSSARCSIACLPCKIFVCGYLKKRGQAIKINDLNLLKYFFNIRQKYILSTYILKSKEQIINALFKCRPKIFK